jgi:predicted GIY-YIG superfamily endonuclease
MPYCIYILKQQKGEFYIGYTEDLKRRLKQHQSKGEAILIYYEAYLSKNLAKERERKLKHYGSAWRALRKRIIA